MVNMELVNKLKALEESISLARFNAGFCTDEGQMEDAKLTAKELELSYKKETIDLTFDDKQKLKKLAEENNVTLKFLFELEFTETQKENVKNGFGLFYEPFPYEDEIIEKLEEEKRRKENSAKQPRSKGNFGKKLLRRS